MILATLLGLAAASALPGDARVFIAVPRYMVTVLPAPLVGLFFLGIWACALGWAGPCQFSGATSLGRDVMMAVRRCRAKPIMCATRSGLSSYSP